jgi:hypothetical protein
MAAVAARLPLGGGPPRRRGTRSAAPTACSTRRHTPSGWPRRRRHSPTASSALLVEAGLTPPDLARLETAAGASRRELLDVLRVLDVRRPRRARQPDLYFSRAAADQARARLEQHCGADGTITPAAFRDLIGASRKFAIALLEWLDRTGVTVRVGDLRGSAARLRYARRTLRDSARARFSARAARGRAQRAGEELHAACRVRRGQSPPICPRRPAAQLGPGPVGICTFASAASSTFTSAAFFSSAK